MNQAKFLLNVVGIVAIIAALAAGSRVQAADSPPEGPLPRTTTIIMPYTQYIWWILRWSDNSIQCILKINHEGLPNADEVYTQCGKTIYANWASTSACAALGSSDANPADCQGVYMFLVNSQPAERQIEVTLPHPQVWVKLVECQQISAPNHCAQLPSLQLIGEEPLPNEEIIALHALVNGREVHCTGNTCLVPLSPTPMSGASVEFWADSSYGDSSERFTAQVRVVDSGVSTSPLGSGWYVDVLSSQWQGEAISTCGQIWDSFPPLGEKPEWLTTPEFPTILASAEPYQYLAGRLISQGLVDARACSSGGLLPNGYSDACGLEQARPLVDEWQNQFDQKIIQVAQDTGVPGQLMKNLFAQESQFWPGVFRVAKEFGLGQLTDNGAETILLWNNAFFNQFCPLVLDASTCGRGYVYLNAENQAMLRGALAVKANADCPTCAKGIDLEYANNFSVDLFAQTLAANCAQVSRIVYNASNRSPGSVSTYEDLWRFTIANYHVGAGCMSYALYTTWNNRQNMNWANVSANLTPACQSAIPYVEKVAR